MRYLLTLMVLVLCAPVTTADVKIDPAHIVLNGPPGLCCWCALETMGTHLGYKDLAGLSKRMDKAASRWDSRRQSDASDTLTKLKVDHTVHWPGAKETWYVVSVKSKGTWYQCRAYLTKDQADQRAAVYRKTWTTVTVERHQYHHTVRIRGTLKKDLAVAVSLDQPPPAMVRHIVVLTDLDLTTNKVSYIDSNLSSKHVQTRDLLWFLKHFNGFAIVIRPPEQPPVTKAAKIQILHFPRAGPP